jgi:phage gpG-like protein
VTGKTDRIANLARVYCPVDTGHLRASITTAVRSEGGKVIGLVGTNVVYATAVHQGSRTSTGRRVEGRPFLRRALTEVMAGP